MKEATARIKINKLLENAAWRFSTNRELITRFEQKIHPPPRPGMGRGSVRQS
jgi:hypothetical protein